MQIFFSSHLNISLCLIFLLFTYLMPCKNTVRVPVSDRGEMEELGETEDLGMAEDLGEVEDTFEPNEGDTFEPNEEGAYEPNEEEPPSICDEFFTPEKEKEDESKGSESAGEPAAIPLVLEPDHPMMQRFQAALKTYLLKQLNKLNDQVREMEVQVKMKETEREETGSELYDMQQEIYRQQKTLEDCETTIENLMKERQSLDESLSCKKMSWKEEVNCLNNAKKKESDMMAELHKLSSLEKQMEKWEKDMESELTLSQRISEKTMYDKNKMIEEKRKMDMYLLRLMTAVSNSESEIRLLEGEIDVKMEEKDMLNQTLADANADLQCLITEQKRLLSAWNSVVSTINQRNLIYTDINKELAKCQEGFHSLNAEIQSYKRSSLEEMKKSEKLAIIHGRLLNEFENCQLTMKNLLRKKTQLEEKLASMAAIINQTELEYQNLKLDTENNETIITRVKHQIELFCQEKLRYEDEAINYIHDQVLQDNSASNLAKKLKTSREKIRKQEFFIFDLENKISHKFLEVEELKEIVARNNEILKEMNTEFNAKENELKNYNDEISKCQKAIIQRQGNYALLCRKIEKYTEMNAYVLPIEQQILNLEKANAEIQAKNDKLQSFWLIQQNNNVKLSQQRSKQLKNISLLRRQVLLLEQKALKIDTEIERERKIENDINKSIIQLQHKLTVLSEILVGKKGYKENLGKENTLTQAQYLQNLKDAELQQIHLKAEIRDLETNLEELAEAMLSTQREMLAWERKIQSALEAKTDMQKEKAGSGELSQMKAEIHRMEVRYGQLKKVQEKLITDLEQCVLKRDVISDSADARELRQIRGFNTRYNIQKKIETLRNNIKSMCNEQKQLEKMITNTEEGHKELKKLILDKEAQLLQMQETTKKMDLELQEGKLNKFQNLEMLIKRQKKCKLYELVKSGKHRLLFKDEELIERELQKAKYTNIDLVSVTETLIENFPAYRFQLRKINNTLQAKPS